MKYTVVIEQPVPEEVRPQLQQLLAERFALTPEQAQKLAARKGGRLMKPTGRERAGVLLEIYQEIGAQVHLEEVSDDAPTTPSSGASAIPTIQPMGVASAATLHATEFDSDALTVGGASSAQSEPKRIVATASPTETLSGSMPAEWSTPSSGGDFWASMSGSASAELQGSPLPQMGASTPPLVDSSTQKSMKLSEVASNNLDTGWADFSSLSVGGQTETPVAAPIEPAAPDTVIQTASLPTPVPAAEVAEAPRAQRQPLAQRLTLPVMVPLALMTALSLLTAGMGLNNVRNNQLRGEARAAAATLAQTLSTDKTAAAQQLSSLVKNNGVGFVQIKYPDGSTLFQSSDSSLANEAGKWLSSNSAAGNLNSSKGSFHVEQVGVYGTASNRTVKDSSDKAGQLYRVAVGTPVTGSNPLLTLLPLLLGGLLTMALGWWLTQQAAQRIVEPINRLVQAADAISMGDLRQSVKAEANDEVGDLAQALERMRLSLDAAMERLRRRRAKG